MDNCTRCGAEVQTIPHRAKAGPDIWKQYDLQDLHVCDSDRRANEKALRGFSEAEWLASLPVALEAPSAPVAPKPAAVAVRAARPTPVNLQAVKGIAVP